MPVQYPAGTIEEHLRTRTHAGLFDVSHMGEVDVRGADAIAFVNRIASNDVSKLVDGQAQYSALTTPEGTVVDDLVIYRFAADHLLLVVNASTTEKDWEWITSHHAGESVELKNVSADYCQLALQGPDAQTILQKLTDVPLAEIKYYHFTPGRVDGIDGIVSRTGYTGEDGFEISVASADAVELAKQLLAQPEVAPIGLGARDSLRLEAGLCLYGHDIDTTTTPVEGSLLWALSKVRRADGARAGGFPGADVILRQIAQGVSKKRVGLLPKDRVPVREGAELVGNEGRVIGKVTSGGFGPTLGGPLAMGYVDMAQVALGTTFAAMVRGKAIPVEVVKTPFVPQRYYRG